MGVGIEALFTSALGLQEPWSVEKVELDTARRRIDFELTCKANRLTCPHCQAAGQGVHDRLKRQWRHLDFFQYEAWLHAQVPRIACTACGKTTQMEQLCIKNVWLAMGQTLKKWRLERVKSSLI
jgi:transposase